MYQTVKQKDGKWGFHLQAPNGELTRDNYASERDAKRGARDEVRAMLTTLLQALYVQHDIAPQAVAVDVTRAAISAIQQRVDDLAIFSIPTAASQDKKAKE